jgi:hypothetical protein
VYFGLSEQAAITVSDTHCFDPIKRDGGCEKKILRLESMAEDILGAATTVLPWDTKVVPELSDTPRASGILRKQACLELLSIACCRVYLIPVKTRVIL